MCFVTEVVALRDIRRGARLSSGRYVWEDRPQHAMSTMTELDNLRQEAETLKNAIRVSILLFIIIS